MLYLLESETRSHSLSEARCKLLASSASCLFAAIVLLHKGSCATNPGHMNAGETRTCADAVLALGLAVSRNEATIRHHQRPNAGRTIWECAWRQRVNSPRPLFRLRRIRRTVCGLSRSSIRDSGANRHGDVYEQAMPSSHKLDDPHDRTLAFSQGAGKQSHLYASTDWRTRHSLTFNFGASGGLRHWRRPSVAHIDCRSWPHSKEEPFYRRTARLQAEFRVLACPEEGP